MLCYFAVCGLLMVYTAYEAAQAFGRLVSVKKELVTVRRLFRDAHPETPSVVEFSGQLQQTLSVQKTQLDQLLQASSSSIPLAECLFRLVEDLPEEMQLVQLSLDPSRSEAPPVNVSFRLPFSGENKGIPKQWLADWKDDESCSRVLPNMILAQRDDNVLKNGDRLIEFSYTADLGKGVSQ
jgi:hypothetical protein